jgi:hypothetical protein
MAWGRPEAAIGVGPTGPSLARPSRGDFSLSCRTSRRRADRRQGVKSRVPRGPRVRVPRVAAGCDHPLDRGSDRAQVRAQLGVNPKGWLGLRSFKNFPGFTQAKPNRTGPGSPGNQAEVGFFNLIF